MMLDMHAVLRSIDFDPDPAALGADPAGFCTHVRLIAGPDDGPGDESFDLTLCTPEWLAESAAASGGIVDGRHHLVVLFESFDRRAVEAWIEKRVTLVSGADWHEVGSKLSRLGYWEFEDYTLHSP